MTSTAGYVCCLSQEPTSATTERRKEFYCASEAYPKSNTKPFFSNYFKSIANTKMGPKKFSTFFKERGLSSVPS
jgi:hypothetical protein